ncbi:MAG TPA: hypothetical protein VI548_11275 [Chitinophagaceae bacterium]|nr:hypothetical protein [Chitinophagaceae bacterium]
MSYIKNYKLLLLIIVALFITNIGLLYFYVWKKDFKPHKSMKEQVLSRLEKEVGFSKEQIAAYDSMRTRHFESIGPMFEELKLAKDSFFNLILQPEVNDSVIDLLSSKIRARQQAIDIKMLKYFRLTKELCTEEQLPKMDSFLKSITKRMYEGPGRRRPGTDQMKR